MKRAEEFLFLLCLVFGGYSAVAALVALFAQEMDAMAAYLLAAVVCLVVVPLVRRVLFRAVGMDDEDEEVEA